MATVLDVAAYVLSRTGDVSTMKLQKLVYYSQAYHLVKTDRPLFLEEIEAWANGPVAPRLFALHRGAYVVNERDLPPLADARRITAGEAETIDHVVRVLGSYTGASLSDLTHSEGPWKDARKGLPDGARSNALIDHASLRRYYSQPGIGNPVFLS